MNHNIAQWKSTYESGNQLVDEQHKFLFSLINKLHNAMLTGQGKSVVNQIIHSLYEYTVVHFSTEEAYMRLYNYPHYVEHVKKHNVLKRRVMEIDTDNVITLSRLLTEWLIEHIQQDDLKMVEFCRNRE